MSKCLILLCGPPACLKSTLSRILRCLLSSRRTTTDLKNLCLNKLRSILQHPLDENLSCFFLSFDQLFINYEEEILQNDSHWKAYRMWIADLIEQDILQLSTSEISSQSTLPLASIILERFSRSSSETNLWIIEDNFYYSSMRHRFHQIAQRAQIGFASIHLIAEISVARQRNARRTSIERVSDRSLEKIFIKYEYSSTDLCLDTTSNGLTIEHIEKVLQRIDKARREPEHSIDVEFEEERRRRATKINRESFLYQLDQKLRKYLSKYLQKTFENNDKFSTNEAKKSFAQTLNEKRQKFFEMMRKIDVPINDVDLEKQFEEFLCQ